MDHINARTNRTSTLGRSAACALALALLAGAAAGQSGAGRGAYEVVIETQQEAQPPAAPRARAAVRSQEAVQHVYEVTQNVDGTTVSVRRVNNEPPVVKLNGQVLDATHYEVKPGSVIITDPATGKQHVVSMPLVSEIVVQDMGLPLQIQGRAGAGENRVVGGLQLASPQPKVMLGVVMVEPDGVVLEHLGLEPEKAVMLERVIEGLPAHKAGLQAKDIIVGFGPNAEPRTADDIRKVLSKAEPGQVVKVKVIRKGEPVLVELKFEAFDANALGRVTGGGQDAVIQFEPKGAVDWQRFANRGNATQESVERALKEAAEQLARLQQQGGVDLKDAHRQAVEAIDKAIEAMRQGQAFGIGLADIQREQQEILERMRQENAQGGANNRLWAQPGNAGEGFTLTIPTPPSPASDARWDERMAFIEKRLVDLEAKLERSMQRLEHQTEAMTERLLNRIERALQEDGRAGGR